MWAHLSVLSWRSRNTPECCSCRSTSTTMLSEYTARAPINFSWSRQGSSTAWCSRSTSAHTAGLYRDGVEHVHAYTPDAHTSEVKVESYRRTKINLRTKRNPRHLKQTPCSLYQINSKRVINLKRLICSFLAAPFVNALGTKSYNILSNRTKTITPKSVGG